MPSVLVEGSSLVPPQFASVFSGDLDSLSSLTTLRTLVAPSSYIKQSSPQPRPHALLNYFLFSSPPTDLSGQKQHVCLHLLLTHLGSHGFSGLLHFWFCFPAPASPDTNGSHSPPQYLSGFLSPFCSRLPACLLPVSLWSLASPCVWCFESGLSSHSTNRYPMGHIRVLGLTGWRWANCWSLAQQ